LALVALLTFSCPAMCAGKIVVSTPAAKGGEPAALKYTPAIVENLLHTLRIGRIPQATMDEGVNKFLQRNGKTWEENPYLPEFIPYIPKDSLSANEKLQLAMYLWTYNDFDNAIPLLNTIRAGNPAAQGLYAVLLYTGRGLKKDERTGKKMFEDNKPALMRLALADANREAIIALALGYSAIPKDATGKSVLPEGQAVAAPLLKKNDPVAIMMLAPANITPTGSGSVAGGVAAVTRAAELGLPPAQMMLGVMFKDGLEKPKDGAKAVYWLTKAADGRMMPRSYSLERCTGMATVWPKTRRKRLNGITKPQTCGVPRPLANWDTHTKTASAPSATHSAQWNFTGTPLNTGTPPPSIIWEHAITMAEGWRGIIRKLISFLDWLRPWVNRPPPKTRPSRRRCSRRTR